MKAIFKGYDHSRLSYNGEVYHTATSFDVVGSKMTTAKVLHFIEKHVNSSVSLHCIKVEKWDSGYFHAYEIMKNGHWIGYVNFFEDGDTAKLTYFKELHDVGLTYGDYELDYDSNKTIISVPWYDIAS